MEEVKTNGAFEIKGKEGLKIPTRHCYKLKELCRFVIRHVLIVDNQQYNKIETLPISLTMIKYLKYLEAEDSTILWSVPGDLIFKHFSFYCLIWWNAKWLYNLNKILLLSSTLQFYMSKYIHAWYFKGWIIIMYSNHFFEKFHGKQIKN